jgi:hypothetical protein
MTRIYFADSGSMTAGRVQIKDGWVKALSHTQNDDGSYTEEQTLIPKREVSRITSTTKSRAESHKVEFR